MNALTLNELMANGTITELLKKKSPYDGVIVYVSPLAWHHILDLPEFDERNIHPAVGTFKVQVSRMLPVEITYDACDVKSRRPIRIPTGEFIHFLACSPLEFKTFWQTSDIYEHDF